MDLESESSISVLKALLKTNRPPTDREKAIVQASMSPTNAKLKVVDGQISDAMTRLQALKLQVEATEIELRRLRGERAAIIETFADHRRVFSPFRNLPGDILRELCLACVENDQPILSYGYIPLPYILAQICTDMRHIALTTSKLWASIHIKIRAYTSRGKYDVPTQVVPDAILARRAREWIQNAESLALNISVTDTSLQSDASHALFDCLLGYSSRWKAFHLEFRDERYTPLTRIAALTDVDVPLLQSISLLCKVFECATLPVFRNSTFLTIPTLKTLSLSIYWQYVIDFNVNWAILTSITLSITELSWNHGTSLSDVARMLQKTRHLVCCKISVDRGFDDYPGEVNLPLLQVLSIHETVTRTTSARICSILDLMSAPILNMLTVKSEVPQPSLSTFLERTPSIRTLSLPWVDQESLDGIIEMLHHCPLLSALHILPSIRPFGLGVVFSDANRFLQTFVLDVSNNATCPRLQHFSFIGDIGFSFNTLQQFLEKKQGGNSMLNNLLPWKSVAIDLTGISDDDIYRRMLNLVSEKLAAGFDVKAFMKYVYQTSDSE